MDEGLPGIPFIGLSATPWARGLGKYYDDLIVAATTARADPGWLFVAFVAFAPSEPDLAGVRTVAGDFHEAQLAEAMDRAVVVGDVVETWLKRGEGPLDASATASIALMPSTSAAIRRGGSRDGIHRLHDPLDRERIFDSLSGRRDPHHLQCRRAHDRPRPGRRCIIDRPSDQEPNSVRPDDWSRSSHGRGQGSPFDPRPCRQPSASRHGDGHWSGPS